jgi:hypothetical protein
LERPSRLREETAKVRARGEHLTAAHTKGRIAIEELQKEAYGHL